MNTVKAIRELLGLTQAAFAEGVGCTQSNVSFYERGQNMPPDVAKRLIVLAKERGIELTLDQVYGLVPLPEAPPVPDTEKTGA